MLRPKTKATIIGPLPLWGRQMLLGAMVLFGVFVLLPPPIAVQALASQQIELQETAITPARGLPFRLLQSGSATLYTAVALGLPLLLRSDNQHKRVQSDNGRRQQNTGETALTGDVRGLADNSLPLGVITLDGAGVEYASSEACRMLGLLPEFLIGVPARELEILLGLPAAGNHISAVLETGQSKGFVVELLHQDRPQQVFVSASRLGTTPPRALLMLQDRSDYQPLSARINLLQQVLDALPRAIVAIDTQNRVIALNESAALILDVEKTKCIGRALASSLAQLLPSLTRHEEVVGQKLRLGNGTDGVQYDIGTRHLRDSHGRAQGTVCIISDHSKERSLAEQAKHDERLEAIGQMAAGTVHEIRNPLAAVRGFAQLLAQLPEAEKAREYSEMTMLEIDRIDQIFSEFLLLSRAVKPDMIPIDLGGVLQNVLQLLQALFEQRHIRVHIDRWQSGQVLGDAHYLQHVFLHLLYNALDATPCCGSVSIELVRLGEVVTVTITDTGSGMDDEVLECCFDPFFTTKETGTGLGLTICRRLLNQMNGFIKIDSTPSVGTTIRVSFPLVAVEAE